MAAVETIALFSDADLLTPIGEMIKVLDPILANECDVVFGLRVLDPSLVGVHQPWLREQSGRLFNRMYHALGYSFALLRSPMRIQGF
jgi:dolichyl-phosphate beta-glucosyltransferase